MGKDDAVVMFPEKLKELSKASAEVSTFVINNKETKKKYIDMLYKQQPLDVGAAKLEIFEEIGTKLIPDDILKNVRVKRALHLKNLN